MGKTNKRNLREDETLAEVAKNTNGCMIIVFLDMEQYIHATSKSFASISQKKLNLILAHYRSETHFKHNAL